MLTNNYINAFIKPTIKTVSKVNLILSINKIISILSGEFAQNISTSYEDDDDKSIISDLVLVDQIIFVIIKNIFDYLFENDGNIHIDIYNEQNENDRSMCISFMFEINERHNSNDKIDILVVDDNEAIRLLLEEHFKGYGLSVASVSDAYNCFDIIRDKQFRLVILDYSMFGMDGLEALETIRRNKKNFNLPVIFYSACPEINEGAFVEKLSNFGPVWSVTKQIDLAELTSVTLKHISADYPCFSFNTYFSCTNLQQNIDIDNSLNYGFIPTKHIAKCINASMIIDDLSDLKKRIVVKFPSIINLNTLDAYCDSQDHLPDQEIKYSKFKQMNSNFRHDLKNKLLLLAKFFSSNDTFISRINNAIYLLDKIKVTIN